MIVKDDFAADMAAAVDDVLSGSGVDVDAMPLERLNEMRAIVACMLACGLAIRMLSPVGGMLHA